jgi:hypothetical protein
MIAAGIISRFTISVKNNLPGHDHLAFMGRTLERDLPTILEVICHRLMNF